jgi:hypothetical protein
LGTAVADVRSLGALADDDQVDGPRVRERAVDAGEQLGRPQVDVVVEGEPEAEQQPALEHAGRDGRVADGAEEDCLVRAQRLDLLVGDRLARAVPAGGTQVVLGLPQGDAGARQGGTRHLQSLGHDLRADPVATDHS